MILRSGLWITLKAVITAAVLPVALMGAGLLVSASAGAFLLATDSLAPLMDWDSVPAMAAPPSSGFIATLTSTPFQPAPHSEAQPLNGRLPPAANFEDMSAENSGGDAPSTPSDPSQMTADTAAQEAVDTATWIASDTQVPSATFTQPRYIPFKPSATRTNTRRPATAKPKPAQPKNESKPNSDSPTPSNTPTAFEASPTPTVTALPSDTETPSGNATPENGEPASTSDPSQATQDASATPSSTPTSTPTSVPTHPTPTNTYTPSPTSSGCAVVYNADFENQTLNLINNERAKVGLAALARNASLHSSALAHSVDMALHAFMAHTGSDGSTFWQRAVNAGYTGHWGGEIIYAGGGSYNTPQQAVTWWMNDPPHKAMIVGDLNDYGAGYAYCPNNGWGGFITVDFGHR